MIISRSSALLRLHSITGRSLLHKNGCKYLQSSRKGHGTEWGYRKTPESSPKIVKLGENLGAIIWWWITWHLITDYDELLPVHFPDPSKWTDEELGIPPV